MNSIKNNNTIFWVLIFLVVINISALATYFIYTRKPVVQPIQPTELKQGISLEQKLGLLPDQTLKVNKINNKYQASSEPIVAAIRDKKSLLLEELSKENSDTSILIKLVEDITNEQKNLQQANIKQFLDLKKVCTPEQTQKLSQIYSELYGCNNNGKGKGQGQGKGMKHRYRHGQQKQENTE